MRFNVGTASPLFSAPITSAGRNPSIEIISTGPAIAGAAANKAAAATKART
jgi:hypothetical protein